MDPVPDEVLFLVDFPAFFFFALFRVVFFFFTVVVIDPESGTQVNRKSKSARLEENAEVTR
ncbi:MAG: hypothetical protein ACREL6_05165 [Gemmatimonadales bacterium]